MSLKSKIVEILKEKNDYVSGEEMSNLLGVSRTAVWKTISRLKEEGYVIEAVTNKGYYLKQSPDLLTEEEISPTLKTRYIGRKIYHYKQVDSTNKEAKKLAIDGAAEGSIVISEEQTAGKGRLGRTWASPYGLGIWMSLILRPQITPVEVSKITLIAALAVSKTIQKVTGLKAEIKWPNDILINKKKVCGILTEMSAEMDKINYIILGIGLNVNTEEFPEEIAHKATSLKIEGKKSYDRKELTQELLFEIENYYRLFTKQETVDKLLEEYKACCVTLNKEVKIIRNGIEYIGKAVGLTENGELLVEKEDGELIHVFSGEVSVRGIDAYV